MTPGGAEGASDSGKKVPQSKLLQSILHDSNAIVRIANWAWIELYDERVTQLRPPRIHYIHNITTYGAGGYRQTWRQWGLFCVNVTKRRCDAADNAITNLDH
jgi:hypothetical protein